MGFDNECILSIQSLAGEYFCPVCRLLVYPNEALQTQCTHLYCKPCLAYIANSSSACPYDGYLVTEADSKPLTECNKVLAETINKIAVHCLYHRSGCTWQGPLSQCITHCSGCAFGNSPVVCNRCGIQIVHRQVQDHAQSCPGVMQPQTQQAVPSRETTDASAGANTLSQISKPAGPVSSQAQTSQADNEAAAPTPEQWYQQQYHQYYQQYAGYDMNNPQYQQYYQQQQQLGALQPQQYQQSHPLPQLQPSMPPQSQLQGPVLAQSKQQPLSNVQQPTPPAQPQVQVQPHGQPQVNPQPQAQSQVPAVPVALPPNQQPQLQPAVLSYPQLNMQSQAPQTLQFNPPNSHLLQHPHELPTQTTVQQHPQLAVHHPTPYPRPLPQSHVQPHSQAHPHGPVSHPQSLHNSQPNPPAIALPQPQVQMVHSMAGYQSYPPPHPSSQVQVGGLQQHPVPTRPLQQSQQSVQVQGHGLLAHSSLPVRSTSAQATMLNQKNPGLLQPPPRSMNFHPAQQPVYPHTHQPGQIARPRTAVQPIQQHFSQPGSQQVQSPSGGQQLGQSQNQLHQQGPLPHQQMPMRPRMPQVPTPSRPPQPQQSLQHPHPSQNIVGRSSISNHGVPSQISPRPPGVVQPGPGFHPTMLERSEASKQAHLSPQNTAKIDEKTLGGNVSEMNAVKSEMDTKHLTFNHKASGNQEVSKKQISKETAQCDAEPSDAKLGRSFLKDRKDFPSSSTKPDANGILAEKENQDGHLAQQNELSEERVEKDHSSVQEPSGSKKDSFAAHGADNSRAVPPAGQHPGRGALLPPLQQRASASSGLSVTPGPPQLHPRGQPLDQFRPPGSGNLQPRLVNPPEEVLSSFSKQPFELAISSGGMPGHGSLPPFGGGHSQFGHDHLHQRMPLAQHLGEIPPGALDKSGEMFISEKLAPNTIGAEKLPERRPLYVDSRHPDPNLQGALDQGSWGHTSRINRPPGVDSSLFFDQEQRFKPLRDEHMHASSLNQSQQVYDRRAFEAELKSSHDSIAKYGKHYSTGSQFDGGPFEKAVHGLTPDGAGSTSSRMIPYDRDVVSGKRLFDRRPEDNIERLDSSRMHIDMSGSIPGYSRRYVEGSVMRSPAEYGHLSSCGFRELPGISRGSLGPHDIVPRESHLYGDPIGNSFPESRFHGFPGYLHKSELEGPGNLRIGEHLRNGDMTRRDLPSHVRRCELLGPQNLRMGERDGYGPFRDHAPAGEPVAPDVYGGHLGFRRSLSLQGHPTDGYRGDGHFDDLRRRRITSMSWCRICKVDCETVEGLDMHSQTTEHQKAAMDMVRSIKQQNAKKQKLSSSDKSSVEDSSRSRTPNSEVRGRKQ